MPTRSPARIPAPYALVKLFLRIISLLLSIIVLIFLIYISVRYTRNFGVAYAAIVYAFFLDTAEILALSDRHRMIPQLPPLSLVICELGALGLLVGGCVTMAFADRGEEYEYRHGKYPADPYRSNAVWIQVAMGAFHVLYALLACVDGCRGIRRGT